jgi:hypothetical protein
MGKWYDLSDHPILKFWKLLNKRGNSHLNELWQEINNDDSIGDQGCDAEMDGLFLDKDEWMAFLLAAMPTETDELKKKTVKTMACVISGKKLSDPTRVTMKELNTFMWDTHTDWVDRYTALLKEFKEEQARKQELENAMGEEEEFAQLQQDEENRQMAEIEMKNAAQNLERDKERLQTVKQLAILLEPLLLKLFYGADQLPDSRCRYVATDPTLGVYKGVNEFLAATLNQLSGAGYPHIAVSASELHTKNRICEAVSYSVWGSELMSSVLKQAMKAELQDHREWYLKKKVPFLDVEQAFEAVGGTSKEQGEATVHNACGDWETAHFMLEVLCR